jgi:hypothetical protein
MMTATEILNEIRKLPLGEQTILKEKFLEDSVSTGRNGTVNGILREMLAEGMISRIPEGITAADDNFKPAKINGKPLSETILEDRD